MFTAIEYIKGTGCLSDILDYNIDTIYININYIICIQLLEEAKSSYYNDTRPPRKYATIHLTDGESYRITEDSFNKVTKEIV